MGFGGLLPAMENLKLKMKEFPSEIMEDIAEGDTVIFNSAAEWLPDKLKFAPFLSLNPVDFPFSI